MPTAELVHVCFHGIGTPARDLEPGEADYWLPHDRFLEILDLLAELPNVRISFDDANRSDVEKGLPALLERELTATFFVVVGRLGRPGSLDVGHPSTLLDEGMSVGNHGLRHIPWPLLSPDQLDHELVGAREILEGITGRPIDRVALPLGRYNRSVLRRLRQLQYAQVCTSDRRLTRTGAWLEHRFSLRQDDTPETVLATITEAQHPRRRLRNKAVGLVTRMR